MLGSGKPTPPTVPNAANSERVQIIVTEPPFGQLEAGRCWWCGEQLVDGEQATRKARLYCRPGREGRDCLSARRQSVAWSPREAIMNAARAARAPLRCSDCDLIVAELTNGLWVRPDGGLGWVATYETPPELGGTIALENLRVRCHHHAAEHEAQLPAILAVRRLSR